jgi:hypothetical protein
LMPKLELICHGGVSYAPYEAKFSALLLGTDIRTREIYPSSEAFMAVADRGNGEGLRLTLDHGTFFEFIPLEELNADHPRRFWLENVECGVNYAVILSTSSGLWSYCIGDTVRFVELSPPRVLVTGRTSYALSLVGEHLIAEEVDAAVSYAGAASGLDVVDYAVSGAIDSGETRGIHKYVVEFRQGKPDVAVLDTFAGLVDAKLQTSNRDYYEHRVNDYGLHRPQVIAVDKGVFSRWMKQRGKLGGQNKVPRMITDPLLIDDLYQVAQL